MPRIPSHPDVAFHRDPDLPGVEVRISSYDQPAFRRHTHETYSVAVIEAGATTFELAEETHRATAGHLVLIAPGEPHSCNPDPNARMQYRLFYIAVDWFATVAEGHFGDSAGVPVFAQAVVDDHELFAAWRDLHVAVMEGTERLELESALVTNITRTIEGYASGGRPERPYSATDSRIDAARELLETRFRERVTLDELAGAAGLSRYHLLRLFQAATGLPPHAYQSQLRVEHGKRLLAEGRGIGEAALECGFSDQSHFTRVFREFTGATPSQYRASSETAR